MNTAILMQYGIPALVAVVSAVAGHWNGKRVAAKSGTTPVVTPPPVNPRPVQSVNPVLRTLAGGASNLWNEPVVQLFFSKLVQAAHDSGHAALDAAVVKMLPGLAPAVPAINSVVDSVEKNVVYPQQPAAK